MSYNVINPNNSTTTRLGPGIRRWELCCLMHPYAQSLVLGQYETFTGYLWAHWAD